MPRPILHGPFAQALPLHDLPLAGPLPDERLGPLPAAGILVDGPLNRGGTILAVGDFDTLRRSHPEAEIHEPPRRTVVTPGLVDAHTHLLWDGSRAADFARRNAGVPYLDIAAAGGGILSTVRATRAATDQRLAQLLRERLTRLRAQGITTAEVKTGYGLTVEHELAQLALLARVAPEVDGIDTVHTCLAAHVCPPEYAGRPADYLAALTDQLLPVLASRIRDPDPDSGPHASQPGSPKSPRAPRIDAFAEPSAFWGEPLEHYLGSARALGLPLTVHADQFTAGGAALAVALGAHSADHLEHVDDAGIAALGASAKTAHPTVAVALPGASIGLGEPFTPARRLLDAGACLAIASDWNPGSAPQGLLLSQATTLAARERLSNAELWAAITFRAARALGLTDRGQLRPGQRADVAFWPTGDYRDISWHMGALTPTPIENQA